MSKAEERACQYTGYCRNQSYSDFLEGYNQAEKDLELSWKDIEKIDDITLRLDASAESRGMSNQEFYQEVLKRFKERKENAKVNV